MAIIRAVVDELDVGGAPTAPGTRVRMTKLLAESTGRLDVASAERVAIASCRDAPSAGRGRAS